MTDVHMPDYVAYACRVFIEGHEGSVGCSPSGVMFNKFMTLLYRDVRRTLGVDIRLPHCWYRWGDEVVRHGMSYLSWNYDSPGVTRVMFTGDVAGFPDDDRVKRYIDSYASRFIHAYSGPEGVEMAVDDVYSEAPFEFQNRFRMLRENLRISKGNLVAVNQTEVVRSLYENAMRVFPHSEFPLLKDRVSEFTAVFEAALDNAVPMVKLQEISEIFWYWFCYHLRLHPRCHENVSGLTLEIWRDSLPYEDRNFDIKMENYAHRVCDGGSDDPVIAEMLVRRNERVRTMRSLLRDMSSGEGDGVLDC